MLNLLLSCVGTIKQATPITTKAASSTDSALQTYPGITSARAISDTKVEIFFPPISGDNDQIAYVIRYSGQQFATYITGSSLKPDYRGLLKYRVTGLQIDTSYDFSVQARNIKTGAESNNNASKIIKTFSNSTANFSGITQVRNLSGDNGLNALEVFWSEAEVRGGLVTKDEIDPIEYQITVINSTYLNPGNMNDTSFTTPERKVFSISSNKRSAIVNGLFAGTKYYVQVRAIHYGFSLNSSNAAYKKEENSDYLEISTYTDDLAALNFDISSFTTTTSEGSNGLYSIDTKWTPPIGNFDHYRLYYAKNGTADIANFLNTAEVNSFCFGAESNNSLISCEYSDYKQNVLTLSGLEPNTKYDLMLAVCVSSDCTRSKRVVSQLINHTTTPPVANFLGISSIDSGKSLLNLDKLTLNFPKPLSTTGNINGLLVDYYGSDPTNPSPIPLNDSSITNTSTLRVNPFNYELDELLSVSGIDPTSSVPYCFLIYPFTYNNDGSKNYFKTGLIPKCHVPTITGPTNLEFKGVTTLDCAAFSSSAVLTWEKPTDGIYNKIELFYIKNSAAFNFGDAVNASDTSYTKILINSNQESLILTGLQAGATYKFGLLTRYESINGIVRSEFNTNIKTCTPIP